MLAQAQKAVATSSIERAANFTGMLMQAGFADAGDKFNPDAAQDEYYDAIGAPPTILRSADEVAAIRDARAQAQAQQAAAEQGQALAQGAKTLSETPTGGDTALAALMEGLA
ncbi:Bacteriophage head to tail connecting protein [compost metagenome]